MTRRTKVAFIAQDSLSILNFVPWFADEFGQNDVSVTTISSLEPVHRPDIEELGTRHIDLTLARFVSPFRDALYVLRLSRILAHERFDVVWTFGTKPNVLASLAARLVGVRRIIIAVRGRGRVLGPQRSIGGKLLRGLLRLLYRSACAGSTRTWFTNEKDRDYFVEKGLVSESKAFLTRNSLNLDKFSPDHTSPATIAAIRRELGFDDSTFVVVMVARLIWAKGIREFVDAANRLRSHERVRFLLIAPAEPGSPDAVPDEYLQEIARTQNIVWRPFRKDIREVYAAADLAVLPSYYQEGGYPRALLEPMALGKAVISSDADDCRGPVEPEGNGLLVPPRDAEALAAAIERLYLDPALRATFGARSLEIVKEKFDNNVVGPQVIRESGLVRSPSAGKPARYQLGPATVVIISPDALSVRLFCTRIVREFQRIPGTRVIVISNIGKHQAGLDDLGVYSVQAPVRRYMDPLGDLVFLWTAYRLLRREHAGLVFNLSTKPNVYGTIAARLARVPETVSYVVGLGTGFLPADGFRQHVLTRTMITLYGIACRWSTSVWFTNPNDRAFFVENRIVRAEKTVLTRFYLDVDGYTPTTVPPDQVEALRQTLGIGPDRNVVVMVARMIWPKGIREFAEAAELLAKSHPLVHFVLVAPLETGSAHSVPESYIREKERTANLTWLEFLHDVRPVYALADVAVLPSYYREGGYPRALTEPMAMGKPLVTTTNEDCRATVEHGKNGYLIPIKDAPALADAIGRLIEQPDLRAAFGRYSREKALLEYDERRIVAEAFQLLRLERLGWCAADG